MPLSTHPRRRRPGRRVWHDLNALYRQHLNRRALRSGEVGAKTRRERRVVLERALRDLLEAGYEVQRLKNLRGRHIRAIIEQWRSRGLQASTLSTYCSHLRVLCLWLGKARLITVLDSIVDSQPGMTRRCSVAMKDRSERGAGIEFQTVLNRALVLDQRFACQLALIAEFGLRSQEAWLFRPHLAEHGRYVRVQWGTKGGRPRELPLPITSSQKAVLEWAKSFAETGAESMVPRGWSVQRWRWRYYRLCKQVGLTRSHGATPHSLRHGVLLDLYEQATGEPAPVRGGNLAARDPDANYAARCLVSQHAGHGRPKVSSAYLGSANTRTLLPNVAGGMQSESANAGEAST